jgi:hypothetical protein
MNKKILFSEKQKFIKFWFLVLIIDLVFLSIPAYIAWGMIRQICYGIPFGNKPASDTELIVLFIVTLISVLLPIFLIGFMKLETIITKEGISFRFFPFHLTFRNYRWEEIESAIVREYSPIKEFGGWGIKYNYRTKIKLFNISGDEGVQIELINGKKFLIGTKMKNELEVVLRKINKEI